MADVKVDVDKIAFTVLFTGLGILLLTAVIAAFVHHWVLGIVVLGAIMLFGGLIVAGRDAF